jgi:hypothetical protein
MQKKAISSLGINGPFSTLKTGFIGFSGPRNRLAVVPELLDPPNPWFRDPWKDAMEPCKMHFLAFIGPFKMGKSKR